jgi:hypothetical protein
VLRHEFADRHADICELRRGVCRNRMARIAFETDQRRVRNERCSRYRIVDWIIHVEAGTRSSVAALMVCSAACTCRECCDARDSRARTPKYLPREPPGLASNDLLCQTYFWKKAASKSRPA